jgi:type III pantothenate kinase
MTILIDVGNTAIKWQLREAEQVVCTDKGDTDELLSWLSSLADPSRHLVAVSCVRDDEFARALNDSMVKVGCEGIAFATSARQFAGVTNAYREPSSLGVDRWLAILALKSFGHESGVVVDIGTACTIDVLENNRHMGGFILPGPKLACDALVENTDKIRFVSEPPAALAPGIDTGGCVVAGAWLTIAGAIREISAQYPQAPLYITGGAGPTLSDLGVEGRLAKDLVFDGLDFWLNGA